MNRFVALVTCCMITACSKPGSDAAATANALRSSTSATGAASTDPVCKLYSSDDAAHYIGKPAKDGELSMGGCQWAARDGVGDMMVQVVPARYDEQPKASRGYRKLPDIGTNAFVSTFMDGWLAGAVVGKDAIRASVSSKEATDATAIALLKETIKRRGEVR
ncbi:MAG: hypothetical protein ABI311_06670 [Gemmatimonadaceae bacterium]